MANFSLTGAGVPDARVKAKLRVLVAISAASRTSSGARRAARSTSGASAPRQLPDSPGNAAPRSAAGWIETRQPVIQHRQQRGKALAGARLDQRAHSSVSTSRSGSSRATPSRSPDGVARRRQLRIGDAPRLHDRQYLLEVPQLLPRQPRQPVQQRRVLHVAVHQVQRRGDAPSSRSWRDRQQRRQVRNATAAPANPRRPSVLEAYRQHVENAPPRASRRCR
jgi:hypothetical protein